MNITIVAYRANGDDYFRGCYVASSDSEHNIECFDNAEDAADAIAWYLTEDVFSDREYCSWETTILFDGKPIGEHEDDLYDVYGPIEVDINKRAKVIAEAKINRRREEDRIKEEEAEKAMAAAQLAAKQLEFERLKKELGK